MRAIGRASLASITTSSSAPWDPDEDEEELLEGSMLKRGTGMFVAWKERLFLLTSKQLLYFEDGRLSSTKGSILLRDVKTFEIALPVSRYGKRYCFSLARAGPSPTWVLCTDTESDFIRWRDALRHAIDAARPVPQSRRAFLPLSNAPHLGQPCARPSHNHVLLNALDPRSLLLGVGGGAAKGRPEGERAAGASASPSKNSGVVSGVASSILHASIASLSRTVSGESSRSDKPIKDAQPALESAEDSELERVSQQCTPGSSLGDIGQHYSLGRVLDKGSNGTVVLGVDKRTGEQVAVKIVEVEGDTREDEGQKEIWQQVQHENMVRLLDYYKTPTRLYFIMELATGKDLFYGVMQHYHSHRPKGFSEEDARNLTSQILTALRHLHLRRIVHCDLKPENILCHESRGSLKLKLADWGFAQVLQPGHSLVTPLLGTGAYMAPEILRGLPYTEKVDMWSAGVIIFVLLCGFPPYEAHYIGLHRGQSGCSGRGLDEKQTLSNIVQQCDGDGRWTYFPSPFWDRVSRDAKVFIQSLLCLDPECRASAESALRDKWFHQDKTARGQPPTSSTSQPQPAAAPYSPGMLPSAMQQMRKYNATRARTRVEHCLGAVVRRMNSGALMAAAAGVGSEDEERKFVLEEEGWQPLISLGWSDNADDRRMAIMSLANISQGRAQAHRLIREGGMRVLVHAISLALASVEAIDGARDGTQVAGAGQGKRARGSGLEMQGKVEEETLHYASMALFHLASSDATIDSLIRHGAHVDLVRIAASPWTACRFQAARALARLCLDSRWQEVLLKNRAVEPLVELAMQIHFQNMQREALDAIKAMACNVEIREDLLAELRVCMRARGIELHECKEAAEIVVESGQEDGLRDGTHAIADEEEKENTPPQDRLLSLMRKLERGGMEAGAPLEHKACAGSCAPAALEIRELSEALSTASGAQESSDSLSPIYAESWAGGGGHHKSDLAFGVSGRGRDAKAGGNGGEGADSNGEDCLGTQGFEDGAQALVDVQGGRIFKGTSGLVQEMAVGDKGGYGGSEGERVAVKFVPLELRPGERAGLLREVVRNYTCGKGLACSGKYVDGGGNSVHPNIIGFRGAIYNPRSHRLGIIMDWVDGPSLQQLYSAARFERDGFTLGVQEAALHAVVYQSLHALVFMHARHLIHRDIKPSSVLLRMDGQVLISNLGNIRHLAKTAGQAASVVGTTCYFAPERIVGSAFQSSVDIWALGVTTLEAATAVFPFKAQQDNYMALLEYIVTCTEAPVERVGAVLSPSLKGLLNKCLANDGDARPSAQELLMEDFVTRTAIQESRQELKELLLLHCVA